MVPIRVLIIEDSEDAASLLIEQLRLGDFDPLFTRVDTAPALLAALERESWDIVFSDHALGHFNSLDALEMLHQRGLEVPFVVISGTADPDLPGKLLQAGAQEFIPKGQTARLLPVVQRELRESASRAAHRQTLTSLRQNESRFRLFYDLASVPYQALDQQARLVDVNPAWLRLMKYPMADVLGRPFADFLAPVQTEQFARQFEVFLNGSALHRSIYRIMAQDQQAHAVALSGRLTLDEHGRGVESYWILEPCTEGSFPALESRSRERGIDAGDAGQKKAVVGDRLPKRSPEDEASQASPTTEVPSLSSLLPICMFCKKIRDSEGEWQVLENFFERRSRVKFSHGFCSDCARKFFPEIFS